MKPVALFEKRYRVFGAASRYLQGEEALTQVGPLAANFGHRAVIVSDKIVLELIGERLKQNLSEHGLGSEFVEFNGELLPETSQLLRESYLPGPSDVIIACGGGRAIDTGKALAEHVKSPLITVPTVASTDAPTSKNYVLYDRDHRLAEVRHMTKNPDAVVVDTTILAMAPKHMFAAGLGDALAKFSEAQAASSANGINMFGATPPRLALAVARCCQETLLRCGASAFDAAGTGTVTPTFEDAVEAMILMAGLGFENGGLSVTHALTRGLSAIADAKDTPHGFQVAYGLCVQHAVAGQSVPNNMRRLIGHVSLPRSLSQLCGRPVSFLDFRTIAEATVDVPHMKNFPTTVSVQDLVRAMQRVETINSAVL